MWMQEYRENYGLSREALGRLADCSGTLIYILERGGITHPRIADKIASICDVGKTERNSTVDSSHWRAGWKQIPKYRARGAKAEKAYFLLLAREKREAEERERLLLSPQTDAEPGQPTRRERGSATSEGGQPRSGSRTSVAATAEPGQPTPVCAVDRKGHVVGRYADCAEAARRYAVQRRTVEARCEHRVGNTDEYFASGVTFRYAAEWDGLGDDERLKRAIEAAATKYKRHKKRSGVQRQGEYTWQGKTHSISEWAKIAGLNKETLIGRLAYGWDIERALTTPVRSREK